MITSYRSNRANSFFEGAAALVHHAPEIPGFLESLDHSNLKMKSVSYDVSDQRVMISVCAVGLLYIRVTGPYLNLLQSQVLYTQFHHYIQMLSRTLDR